MKEGIITLKWNYLEDGVVIAQCFATTKHKAVSYFEEEFQYIIDVSDVVITPNFNTKEPDKRN